jgi:hypothetical protein
MHHQDSAFMALRLLLLRSVERLADDSRSTSNNDASVLSTSVLSEVLHVVKSCTSSRLQFASLLLEVGRQLEPSCFPYLFPLPVPREAHKRNSEDEQSAAVPPIIGTRCNNVIELRSVGDLFLACVDDGSVLSSVSSLPIIRTKALSKHYSMLIFVHCLRALMDNTEKDDKLFFDFSQEERSTIHDVFRFGVKLEDSVDAFIDLDVDRGDESMASTSDSSASDEDDDGASPRKSYSLTCGMLKMSLFRGRSAPVKKQEMKKLVKKRSGAAVGRKAQASENDADDLASFGGSVSTLLVQMLFPGDAVNSPTYCWKRSAALAYLLLGQNESLLRRASVKECTNLATLADKSISLQSLNKADATTTDLDDRIANQLTRCFVAASMEVSVRAAGRILDMALVLLARSRMSSDFDSTVPGLLFCGITAAHISDRIKEILDIDDRSSSFTRAYLKAKEKADSLHYC